MKNLTKIISVILLCIFLLSGCQYKSSPSNNDNNKTKIGTYSQGDLKLVNAVGYTDRVTLAKEAIENGANLDELAFEIKTSDGNIDNPLWCALYSNCYKTAEYLIGEVDNLDKFKDSKGNTYLNYCLDHKYPILKKLVKPLIDNGANVNIANDKGDTPLITCILNSSSLPSPIALKYVKLLVEKGATIDKKTIKCCIENRDRRILDYLLENVSKEEISKLGLSDKELSIIEGKDVKVTKDDLKDNKNFIKLIGMYGNSNNINNIYKYVDDKDELLEIAASNGNTDCISYLIENKIDINSNIDDLETKNLPLLLSVINNYYDASKMLIENGAKFTMNEISSSIDGIDNELAAAAINGNKDLIKLVMDNCGEVEYDRVACAIINASIYDQEDAVEYMLKAGLDPNSENTGGDSIISNVAYYGDAKAVNLLLQYGADCEGSKLEKESDTNSPLLSAVQYGDADSVLALLKAGANPNENEDILYNAINNNDYDILKVLLENDIKVKDIKGRNPLSYASSFSTEIMKLLVEYGADINSDDYSDSPIYIAVEQNNVANVEILLENNVDLSMYNNGEDLYSLAKENKEKEMLELFKKYNISGEDKNE